MFYDILPKIGARDISSGAPFNGDLDGIMIVARPLRCQSGWAKKQTITTTTTHVEIHTNGTILPHRRQGKGSVVWGFNELVEA